MSTLRAASHSLALAGFLGAACGAPSVAANARAVHGPSLESRPPSVRSASGAKTPVPDPGVQFRFHAGSTVPATPVLGPDGTLYVGTGDGLLEAIGADGALAWSYTLDGTVARAPVLDSVGHVVVATWSQHLYSFTQSGALAWHVRTPTRAATDLVVSPAWGVLFGGSDDAVWAYSSHATAAFHVVLGSQIAGAPAARGSRIAAGTARSVVLLDGAMKKWAAPLDAPVRTPPVLFADGTVAVVAGDELRVLSKDGTPTWTRKGVAWIAERDGELLSVDLDGKLSVSSLRGELRGEWALGLRATAPPAPAPWGAIYVAGDSGALAVARADGTTRTLSLGTSALHRPVVDGPRVRVLVAAGDGTVTALPGSE